MTEGSDRPREPSDSGAQVLPLSGADMTGVTLEHIIGNQGTEREEWKPEV